MSVYWYTESGVAEDSDACLLLATKTEWKKWAGPDSLCSRWRDSQLMYHSLDVLLAALQASMLEPVCLQPIQKITSIACTISKDPTNQGRNVGPSPLVTYQVHYQASQLGLIPQQHNSVHYAASRFWEAYLSKINVHRVHVDFIFGQNITSNFSVKHEVHENVL